MTKQDAIEELLSALRQERDEIRLQVHLGTQSIRDQFNGMSERLNRLKTELQPLADAVDESASDVLESLKLVAEEIKAGFSRIRESL